jgi:hypothetical protein
VAYVTDKVILAIIIFILLTNVFFEHTICTSDCFERFQTGGVCADYSGSDNTCELKSLCTQKTVHITIRMLGLEQVARIG